MSFAETMNQYALDTFKEVQRIEGNYSTAEAEQKKYRMPSGDADYRAKAVRANAEFEIAGNELRSMRRNLPGEVADRLSKMRNEYSSEIEKRYNVNHEDIDMRQLELIRSGILKPSEYTAMLKAAAESGNVTMTRLIGKYASEAAEEYGKKYGINDRKAVELRMVANAAAQDPVSTLLGVYDGIADIIRRSVNNPSLIPHWEELAAPMLKLL